MNKTEELKKEIEKHKKIIEIKKKDIRLKEGELLSYLLLALISGMFLPRQITFFFLLFMIVGFIIKGLYYLLK